MIYMKICVYGPYIYCIILTWIADINGTSDTSLHSIRISLLMCNSGPQVACQLTAAKFTKRYKLSWRLHPQWFQQGEQAQNDAKRYKATTIYPYITNTMDKVHPASQWINHRPTTVSSLRGKYLSHRDMCPAAALRQLHWWLHPLSRPGLRCFHRNEIAWKCLTWISIAVGWTSIIFESIY